MDPTATWADIVGWAEANQEDSETAQQILDLHEWVRKGGYWPVIPEAEKAECRHCHRTIVKVRADVWIDPEAPARPEDGDDHIWRETCDANDTFVAEHEPQEG